MTTALIGRPPDSVEEKLILPVTDDIAEFDARVAGPGHRGWITRLFELRAGAEAAPRLRAVRADVVLIRLSRETFDLDHERARKACVHDALARITDRGPP